MRRHLGAVLFLVVTALGCGPSGGTTYGSGKAARDAGSAGAGTASEQEKANRVLELVNAQRRGYGLAELTWCTRCAEVAYAHCEDMQERQFFDHVNPDGKDPFARMDAAGITYSAAGENIAEGYATPEDVMAAWMQSPGHRANILNADFTELGVGMREGDSPGPWWTQVFRTP